MVKNQFDKTLTDDQVQDFVACLDSLTGKFPHITMPRLPATSNTVVLGK